MALTRGPVVLFLGNDKHGNKDNCNNRLDRKLSYAQPTSHLSDGIWYYVKMQRLAMYLPRVDISCGRLMADQR